MVRWGGRCLLDYGTWCDGGDVYQITVLFLSGGSAGAPAALLVMNERAIDAFGRPAFTFYAVVKKFFKVRSWCGVPRATFIVEKSGRKLPKNARFLKFKSFHKIYHKYTRVSRVFLAAFSCMATFRKQRKAAHDAPFTTCHYRSTRTRTRSLQRWASSQR